MRKAFTLIEMLMVTAILMALMTMTGGLFRSLLQEPPAICRASERAGLVNLAMDRVRNDIDIARTLPVEYGGRSAAGNLLLIELADGVIGYEFGDEKLTRFRLSPAGDKTEARSWVLPNATVQWQLRRHNGRALAVEVQTAVTMRVGRDARRLVCTRVFFLPANNPDQLTAGLPAVAEARP